jgi:cyanophycin synthetase
MNIQEVSIYRGPHIYSLIPMLRLQIDLGPLEILPTDKLGEFADVLLKCLPGLHQHGCSYEMPGGFTRRLKEGTWLGHVAEHVALEIQKLAGADVSRGKTRSVLNQTGVYDVLYEYENDDVGLLCGVAALKLLSTLLPPSLNGFTGVQLVLDRVSPEALAANAWAASDVFDLDVALTALRLVHRSHSLGPTTAALIAEAKRRGIPVQRMDDSSLVQLGYGKQQKRIWAAMTSSTSQIAVDMAADKDLTKNTLKAIGLPVPQGCVVTSADQLGEVFEDLCPPLVAKPLCGNHGRGVSLHLKTLDDLQFGFMAAQKISRSVVVEEQYAGKDYRILVVDGRTIAVAERVPAHIVGDGERTVAQLIEIENLDPRRGDGHEKVMTKIVVDDAVIQTLAKAGLTTASIPARGQTVFLRSTGNISTGGTAVDCTDKIHPENAKIAERAALAIGLDVAGIDFIAPDITQPVSETGGGIVEVNAAPGLRMHMAPSVGSSQPVAERILDTVFPPGSRSRIPIFAVTGTNGKSTTSLMLERILRKAGLKVGLANTSGVFIDGTRIMKADASGPRSAKLVLSDPTVEVAVLETARGGIVREGLAFDDCDAGAVLNIDADHLGLRNISTVDDLAWAKSLVVEVVHRSGTSVLNADDPRTCAMAKRAGGHIAYFSLQGDSMSELLQSHISGGGLAVMRSRAKGDEILIYDGGKSQRLMAVSEIPATLHGAAEFNVANAMAAAAMAYGYGIDIDVIRTGLSCFSTSLSDNPGRLNFSDELGFRVVIDYGHNPASLRAVGRLIDAWRPQFGRVIGMVSMPGDRRDDDMREMGKIAGGLFDHVVFRETPDQRGRAPGTINRLMTEGALTAGCPLCHISPIIEEFDAIDFCLRTAQPNDLVVLMATRFDEAWQRVHAFHAAGAGVAPLQALDARVG